MTKDQSTSGPTEPLLSGDRASFMRSYVLRLGLPIGLVAAILYHIKYFGFVPPTTFRSIVAFLSALAIGSLGGYLFGVWEWRARTTGTHT